MMKIIDWLVARIFTLNVDLERTYCISIRGEEEEFIDHVLTEMDIIDSKSGTLLTHVTIMLAVAALFIDWDTTMSAFEWLMVVELGFFLVCGILGLSLDPPDNAD